jgi:hypothetical protein
MTAALSCHETVLPLRAARTVAAAHEVRGERKRESPGADQEDVAGGVAPHPPERALHLKILGDFGKRGQTHSPTAGIAVFQAYQDELAKRGEAILSEIRRILNGAYIEEIDNVADVLKADLISRLQQAADIANSEFLTSTEYLRKALGPSQSLPSSTAISESLEKLKPRLLAEIDLFCAKLHDNQAPRLFLKAGEVFAGNRAARAIFAAAKQSLDIIDTYFGSQVFDMLEVSPASVRIRLISNRADGPTRLALTLFNQQFNNRAEFRLCDRNTDKLHNRFIIVDGVRALHLGGSIKHLGNSDSLIDSAELEPHKIRFQELWLRAQPVI